MGQSLEAMNSSATVGNKRPGDHTVTSLRFFLLTVVLSHVQNTEEGNIFVGYAGWKNIDQHLPFYPFLEYDSSTGHLLQIIGLNNWFLCE